MRVRRNHETFFVMPVDSRISSNSESNVPSEEKTLKNCSRPQIKSE